MYLTIACRNLKASIPSPAIPTESAVGASTALPLPTSSTALVSPASDCSSLRSNSAYLVAADDAASITRNVTFDIRCDRDFKLPLVMAIRAFSFEDCINACASHATNAQDAVTACVAAVYKPDSGQPLTCWLKSKGPANAIQNNGVDSARISGS